MWLIVKLYNAILLLCSCSWAAAGRAPAAQRRRRTAGPAQRLRCRRAGQPWPGARSRLAPAATPALLLRHAATPPDRSSQTQSLGKRSARASTTERDSPSRRTLACPARLSASTEHLTLQQTKTPTPALASIVQRSIRRWYVQF